MKKINESKKQIKTEVFKLENPIYTNVAGAKDLYDKWSRVEMNGELLRWIPHNEYGELSKTKIKKDVKNGLENRYQEFKSQT